MHLSVWSMPQAPHKAHLALEVQEEDRRRHCEEMKVLVIEAKEVVRCLPGHGCGEGRRIVPESCCREHLSHLSVAAAVNGMSWHACPYRARPFHHLEDWLS